jgi:host factor-I protein
VGILAAVVEEGLMDKPAQNIQDAFLNNARKEKGVITIYLLSGVKLSGRIKSFDKYSLVLETNNQEQLIFNHSYGAPSPAPAQTTAHSTAAAHQESTEA